MRSLSLTTRLFLSSFLVSALLFCGIYFYVKGFNEQRDLLLAERSFDQAEARLEAILAARKQTIPELGADLEANQNTSVARAEFDATGMSFALVRNGEVKATGIPLINDDRLRFRDSIAGNSSFLSISAGHYLTRTLHSDHSAELILLYPLAELERASRELLKAFLVAGLALLLLSAVLAQVLAREISRPLISLRNQMRAMAESIGFDAPDSRGDEMSEIAAAYADFAQHVKIAFEHKALALDELQAYKAELLRVNYSLHRRLFQVKVLLTLWSERDQALDVKDLLSRFLEALLPGLPFEYGCVIIRPLADLGAETIFAKKVPGPQPGVPGEETNDGTLWTDILDPTIKEFLLQESAACMASNSVRLNAVLGCVRPGIAPAPVTVLSFRLQQGDEPLGSVHFLTEHEAPPISAGLNDFLLNLSAQVSAQLQIQALSFSTRLDPITRLYNRGYLQDRLREELVRASRKKEAFSVALVEINDLPHIAQKYGQPSADEALRGLAALLKSNCRGSDTVCRFSSSVLAIVLADTPLAGANIFADNVRRAAEANPFAIPAGTLRLSVSVGTSAFPQSGDSLDALLAQAEHALFAAKNQIHRAA